MRYVNNRAAIHRVAHHLLHVNVFSHLTHHGREHLFFLVRIYATEELLHHGARHCLSGRLRS